MAMSPQYGSFDVTLSGTMSRMMKIEKHATANIAVATTQSDLCIDLCSSMDGRLSVTLVDNIPRTTECRFSRLTEGGESVLR